MRYGKRITSGVSQKDIAFANKRLETIHYVIENGEDVGLSNACIANLLEEMREYLEWIRQIYKKYDEYPEYVNERKIRYELGIVEFALPQQLDRSRWEQFYDREKWLAWHEEMKERNIHSHGSKYARYQESTLSWSENLRKEVVGNEILYDNSRRQWGILPEISGNGSRRCIFLDQEGRRCLSYSTKGILCQHHTWAKKYLRGYLMSQDSTYSNIFKSTSLKEMYDEFMNSDARDLRGEIAMQRTMLASVVKKVQDCTTVDTLPLEMVEFITNMTGKIANTIKKYDDMQQKLGLLITPDQLNRIMMRMLETVKDVLNVSHEDFLTLANAFATLQFSQRDPASMLQLTQKVTVDSNYGAEVPPGTPEVTHTTCTTRYLKGGGVIEIDAQVEKDEHENRQAHMIARHGASVRNKPMVTEDDYHPRTQVNGVEVPMVHSNAEVRHINDECEIGDANDPFVVPS